MIIGLHNFTDAMVRYKDEVLSSEGGLWLVGMNGLLLIPLAMAAFFYPVIALEALAVMAVLTIAGLAFFRRQHRRRT